MLTGTPAIAQDSTLWKDYLHDGYSLRSWLLSTDHKRIGLLYAFTITFFFLLGGVFTIIMRLSLLTPQADMLSANEYNKLFTMHGLVMVFLFFVPGLPAIFANFLLPLMIGARNLAFPRLNLATWYIYAAAASLLTLVMLLGGVDTGWTFYAPYSLSFATGYVILSLAGICLAGLASSLTAINVIVTIFQQRTTGMTWFRLPLFVWSQLATAFVILICTPVGIATFLMLGIESQWQVGIFDPQHGGDPLLFQQLFWFYAHPIVYIMVLPAMGIVSEVIACFAHKRIFGYRSMVFTTAVIALLSLVVWGNHLVVSGQSVYATFLFALLGLWLVVPFSMQIFSWLATLHKSSIHLKTPLLYAFSFICLLIVGGVSGILLIAPATSVHLHNTYFAMAHFHYMVVGTVMTAYLAAIHFWWPKITGRLYSEFWGKLNAMLFFIGFNATFLPMLIVGYLGMPIRYSVYPAEFTSWQVMASLGLSLLAIAYVLPIVYLTYAFYFGEEAEQNPWQAKGLEWEASDSPPVKDNFRQRPTVTQEAYAYESL